MGDLFELFSGHWQKNFGSLSKRRLLVAVSGGVDSVVLTDLLVRMKLDLVLVHCNFQLRGEESERDEAFVRSLATQYDREVRVRKFDTKAYSADKKISIQEAARELRYEWFASLVNSFSDEGPAALLTAHHADDVIETVLMHLFRGTGIRGLTGIQAWQPDRSLLRPLLIFRKEQLGVYAQMHNLPFVEDASNLSDAYTRNYFRNRLLPGVREMFPRAEENLLHTIDHLNEVVLLYEGAVQTQLKLLLEQKGKEWHIPVLKWKKSVPLHTLSWELLRPFGFTPAQTDAAIRLLDANNGAYLESPTHRLIRNRKWMILAPNDYRESAHIVIEQAAQQISFQHGILELSKLIDHSHSGDSVKHTNHSLEAWIDASLIQFPLLLRPWKTGDYFYPLGMQKKKKLSRFFIDQKLSKTDKEKVWVLEMGHKIIWIVGYRIDDRFKIKPTTQQLLQLNYTPR